MDLGLPLALAEPYLFGALLVLLRVAGALTGLPFLANPAVPGEVRLLGTLWLTILAFVTIGAPAVPATVEPLRALPLFFGELLVGAAIGFAARMILGAVEVAAAMIGIASGLNVSAAVDPITGAQHPALGQAFVMLAMLVFVGVGGHMAVIGALLDSFRRFPVGAPDGLASLFENVVATGGTMFGLGFRLAAPIAVVGLVVNVGLGLLTKVAPQLNIFAVGFIVVIGASLLVIVEELPAVGAALREAMTGIRETLVSGTFSP